MRLRMQQPVQQEQQGHVQTWVILEAAKGGAGPMEIIGPAKPSTETLKRRYRQSTGRAEAGNSGGRGAWSVRAGRIAKKDAP